MTKNEINAALNVDNFESPAIVLENIEWLRNEGYTVELGISCNIYINTVDGKKLWVMDESLPKAVALARIKANEDIE